MNPIKNQQYHIFSTKYKQANIHDEDSSKVRHAVILEKDRYVK
jgi:hypothetical protein